MDGITVAVVSLMGRTFMRPVDCPFSAVEKLIPEINKITKIEKSKLVGAAVARKAIDLGLTAVVFDRGGNLYHGRVKALADAAREAGLTF